MAETAASEPSSGLGRVRAAPLTPTRLDDVLAREGLAAPLSPRQLVWRRFRRHRMALAAALVLAGILLFITLGTVWLSESAANQTDPANIRAAPSLQHLFGTDGVGRDQLARIVYGGQISLAVGTLAVIIAMVLGVLIGGLAGYLGGWVDSLLMRFTEAMLCIPNLFLLILVGKMFAPKIAPLHLPGREVSGSVLLVIAVIGVTNWMAEARIVRATVLSLKEQDYIQASLALGASHTRIFLSHILPNTVAPIIVAATLGLANAILLEAYASYLGLGVQPPTASWGNMLDKAQPYLQTAPWLWVFPGLFILLTVLCINFLGDGLRDALDPRARI